jgi:carboxyl-terminal processing protease
VAPEAPHRGRAAKKAVGCTGTTGWPAANSRSTTRPDERGINTDIAREKEAKEKRDIILDEAAHILADEIGLIRADTKLAAQVLPRGAIVPTEVN